MLGAYKKLHIRLLTYRYMIDKNWGEHSSLMSPDIEILEAELQYSKSQIEEEMRLLPQERHPDYQIGDEVWLSYLTYRLTAEFFKAKGDQSFSKILDEKGIPSLKDLKKQDSDVEEQSGE